VPLAVFFPGRGEETATARAVCGACPVVEECRAYALDIPGLKGVWGGLSEHERLFRRHQPVVPGVEVEVEAEAPPPVSGPATSAPGTLLACLEELAGHQGQWARVARYASSHSAGALASLLRRGRRPVPAGRWCFEGHVDDEGGSALWACYEGAVDRQDLDEPLAG
jgi:hypothetical protein